MRVLICPDKFRGTLTGRQAAEAIERGWRRSRPDDEVMVLPLADGGEGTLDTLVPPGEGRVSARVAGPLGDPVVAEAGMRGEVGVVEMAKASGLELIDPSRRDPSRTSTRGTGELMRRLLDDGARSLTVCLGGSATNDGGMGMARALGVRFEGADRREIAEGGAALLDLVSIDLSGLDPRIARTDVTGVTDVDNPLCGPNGASATYGPQKGATEDMVWVLDRALGHLAAIVARDLAIDLRDEAGAGAAGGLGFGLLAFCGARLRPGVDVVMETVGFDGALREADLVITGEGSFDEQSLRGKVPAGVLRRAAETGTRVAILCGVSSVAPDGATVRSLVDRVGERAALDDARRSLELVAEELAGESEVLAS
jgi:glycerate 2-kinase